jgi:hypothetical protein
VTVERVSGGKCVNPYCDQSEHVHYTIGPVTLAEVLAERDELRADNTRLRDAMTQARVAAAVSRKQRDLAVALLADARPARETDPAVWNLKVDEFVNNLNPGPKR